MSCSGIACASIQLLKHVVRHRSARQADNCLPLAAWCIACCQYDGGWMCRWATVQLSSMATWGSLGWRCGRCSSGGSSLRWRWRKCGAYMVRAVLDAHTPECDLALHWVQGHCKALAFEESAGAAVQYFLLVSASAHRYQQKIFQRSTLHFPMAMQCIGIRCCMIMCTAGDYDARVWLQTAGQDTGR